jgi:hypothetical protein
MDSLSQKFLPGLLERHELPKWFIDLADSRSLGHMEYIIWDTADKNIIHADYFIDGEFLECKRFDVRIKKRNT